jgi:hypothetical protein
LGIITLSTVKETAVFMDMPGRDLALSRMLKKPFGDS